MGVRESSSLLETGLDTVCVCEGEGYEVWGEKKGVRDFRIEEFEYVVRNLRS